MIEDIRSQLLQPDEVQLDSHEESKPEERNKPTNTTGQKNKKKYKIQREQLKGERLTMTTP